MADGSSQVRKTGAGFFDSTGKLKSKEDLAREEKAQKSEAASTSDAVKSDVSSSALDSVRQRTYNDVNQALNQNSDARSLAKAQEDLTQKKIDVVKELKKKSDDEQGTEELKQQYADLEKQQEDLNTKVEAHNRQATEQANQNIRVGNKSYGSFDQIQVTQASSKRVDLDTDEGLANALSQLKEDKQASTADVKAANAQRADIKEAASQALDDIKSTAAGMDNAISNADVATQVANSTAAAIRSAGANNALAAFNPDQHGGTQAVQQVLSGLMS